MHIHSNICLYTGVNKTLQLTNSQKSDTLPIFTVSMVTVYILEQKLMEICKAVEHLRGVLHISRACTAFSPDIKHQLVNTLVQHLPPSITGYIQTLPNRYWCQLVGSFCRHARQAKPGVLHSVII